MGDPVVPMCISRVQSCVSRMAPRFVDDARRWKEGERFGRVFAVLLIFSRVFDGVAGWCLMKHSHTTTQAVMVLYSSRLMSRPPNSLQAAVDADEAWEKRMEGKEEWVNRPVQPPGLHRTGVMELAVSMVEARRLKQAASRSTASSSTNDVAQQIGTPV